MTFRLGLTFNRTFFALDSCGKRKSHSPLQYDSEYNEEGLTRLCLTISVEPTIQENVASSVSVERENMFYSAGSKYSTQ